MVDVNLANNQICDIHKTAFDAVKHSVQTLNIGFNCLPKVLRTTFDSERRSLGNEFKKK